METKHPDTQITEHPLAASPEAQMASAVLTFNRLVEGTWKEDSIVMSVEAFWGSLETLKDRVKNSGVTFKNIFAIPRGGFIPGVYLSHQLHIPMIFDVGQISPTDTLIVDDVYETGATFAELKGFYDADNLAVLVFKRGMRRVDTLLRPAQIWCALDETKKRWIRFPYE